MKYFIILIISYYPHMWNMERSMLELLEIILLRMDLYDQQVFEKNNIEFLIIYHILGFIIV